MRTHTPTQSTYDLPLGIQAAREAAGLSQTRLAALAGLQPSYICHAENGRRTPTLANLMRLADALGVTLDELCKRSPLEEPNGG